MLMPKRVKHRKQQRGKMRGRAYRGNKVTYGDFGIMAMEPTWITSNQIEAARVAMTFGSKYSLTNPYPQNLLVLVWVPVKAHLNTGLQ